MSLKEDLSMVKDELSSEEKFFEKAVVTEKFVKKYKKVLIGSVVAIVLVVAGDIAYELNKERTLSAANEALMALQQDPKNVAELSRLESLSPVLHDVWLYSQAVVKQDVATLQKLQNSKAMLLNDLATYEVAQNKQELQQLESYAQKQHAIYRDLAQVEAALIYIHKGDVQKAHTKLAMIREDSPLSKVAQALLHYGVK